MFEGREGGGTGRAVSKFKECLGVERREGSEARIS